MASSLQTETRLLFTFISHAYQVSNISLPIGNTGRHYVIVKPSNHIRFVFVPHANVDKTGQYMLGKPMVAMYQSLSKYMHT